MTRRAPNVNRALIAVGAIVAVVLSGCGDDDDDSAAAANADDSSSLNGTAWVLSSYVIETDPVEAVGVATLEFGADGTTLNGSTGCNSFGGKFEQQGNSLVISLGPTTLAACPDDEASDQQESILDLLPQVESFLGGADQMTLQDNTGSTLLIYAPGTAGLEGTSWTATGVNTGGAVESNTLTGTITATFGPDGALSGFSGCNQYNATYTSSGADGLRITDVATTRMACDDAAMTLEGQYTTALGKVATYDISGATLTLRDASGAIQVSFTIAS
jgi:heat shock protein HslJ